MWQTLNRMPHMWHQVFKHLQIGKKERRRNDKESRKNSITVTIQEKKEFDCFVRNPEAVSIY